MKGRMNIIWVSLYSPLPLNFGGPVGIYRRLKEMVKYDKVLLFYSNESQNPNYDFQLEQMCEDVHSYPRNKAFSADFLECWLRVPYTVATRNNNKMKRDL